jgi:hypothetical protein
MSEKNQSGGSVPDHPPLFIANPKRSWDRECGFPCHLDISRESRNPIQCALPGAQKKGQAHGLPFYDESWV